MSWAYLEPSEGRYNWTYLDTVSTLAQKKAQKTASLWEIQVMSGVKPGENTPFYPAWVVTDGAKTVTLHSNKGVTATICVPWDPVFQAKWQALINAVAIRYDSNVLLRAVLMTGVGRDAECYFCSNNPTYIGDWNWVLSQTPNGTVAEAEQLWENAAEKIGSFYFNAFLQTPCLYGTAVPMPKSVDPNNDKMGAVVSWLNGVYNVGNIWRFGTR